MQKSPAERPINLARNPRSSASHPTRPQSVTVGRTDNLRTSQATYNASRRHHSKYAFTFPNGVPVYVHVVPRNYQHPHTFSAHHSFVSQHHIETCTGGDAHYQHRPQSGSGCSVTRKVASSSLPSSPERLRPGYTPRHENLLCPLSFFLCQKYSSRLFNLYHPASCCRFFGVLAAVAVDSLAQDRRSAGPPLHP